MKMGMCELCNKKARLHCESDQARLCWECDEKVHGANFLVAKHCRSVLCHVCQSTTPWKASGPKLFPTISVCGNCSVNKNSRIEKQEEEEEEEEINQPQIRDQENGGFDGDQNQEYTTSSEDDDDDDEDEEYEDVEEDDGENQVVPWAPSPPVASSSSCSEEEVVGEDGGATAYSSTVKRVRQTDYQDDERSFSQNCGISSLNSLRPWKLARNGDSRSITTDPDRE